MQETMEIDNLKTKYPISTFGEETQKEIIALVQEEIKQAIQKREAEILEWATRKKGLSSFKLRKDLSEKIRMYHYAIEGTMEDLINFIKQ